MDIGGRGFTADAASVYEEGLCIPIMKFAERGAVNHQLINIIRNNVRVADQVVGDIYSLANCNQTGHNRLIDMLGEFELDDIDDLSSYILDHSYNATLDCIGKLKPGSAENTLTVDGYFDPIHLAVRVSFEADRIVADFDGTDGVSSRGINVPMVYTKAYACYGIKCVLAPDIPNNSGSPGAVHNNSAEKLYFEREPPCSGLRPSCHRAFCPRPGNGGIA